MKTALRKDQTGRHRVISKQAGKTASKSVSKTSFQSELRAALKMYEEFNRNKERNKITTNAHTIGIKGSKASEVDRTGNEDSQHVSLCNISICPVKRSVTSLEMGIVTG